MSWRVVVAGIAWALLPFATAGAQEWAVEEEAVAAQESPQQRDGVRGRDGSGVLRTRITPHWFAGNARFWYRNDGPGGTKAFVAVDAERGARTPAFDHAKLAEALAKAAGGGAVDPDRLPFDDIAFADDGQSVVFRARDATWRYVLASGECSKTDAAPPEPSAPGDDRPNPGRRGRGEGPRRGGDRVPSPDGKRVAFLRDHNVFLRVEEDGKETQLSDDGTEANSYDRVAWSPDGKSLVAFRVEPGDRKEVYLVRSSPPGGGRARLETRPYPLPGDKFAAFEVNLFDVETGRKTRPELDRVDFGYPQIRWRPDGRHFAYTQVDRGHQRLRVVEVDARTGEHRNLIDEKSDTFIWTAHTENVSLNPVTWLESGDEILHASERDGWRHLYLVDANKGEVKAQVTRGEYVVRGIDRIDEANRQVWFRASGKVAGQDPYFVHHYRVNFDGTGLVALTEGDGSHTVQLSPDGKYLIDTFSRVDLAPVHNLRRTGDGSLVCALEEADISALRATGWQPPEVFSAKGRDGRTDIWGIICRPKDFDPARKYPVIEQIYAGPQGSYVPKTFSPARRFAALTDLGFIVVQMDGMGTANRSKAFHDVCWKNLKDAGFPDRILWHEAAARKHPELDLSRVGIYGGSAGGQNAAGAVLFHPEFYKAAVASCGCHDNRMDKASWNEQWMGYPVGPQYAESSNIDNAPKLGGKLLLIVGEVDTNVPPESTYRLCDALIRANKDFDFLMVPNADHGNGGPYGERKQNAFFVRHLKPETVVPASGPAPQPESPRDPAVTRARSGDPAEPDLELGDAETSELRGAIERYGLDARSFARTLPPAASPRRDEQARDFAARWLEQLGRVPFSGLGPDGRVDYLLFRNYLQHEVRAADLRIREKAEAAPLVPFAAKVVELDQARRELKPENWGEVAGTLAGLAKEVDAACDKLKGRGKDEAKTPQAVANRALAQVEGVRATLREWNGFYDGYDPLFTWWNAEPYKAADAALQGYANALRDRTGARDFGDAGRGGGGGGAGSGRGPRGGAGAGAGPGPGGPTASTPPAPERDGEIVGNPIGRDALLSELQFEMIPYTPEELVEIARREFAWCEGEMKKASAAMGLGDDWKAALERVKTQFVEPGRQPALIRDLADEATRYVVDNNLVTVPPLCRDSWRMAMMSPDRQLVNPFFTGGETISVSYPVAGMSHEQKLMSMRGNNPAFARATVHHELIPGHHLESFMSARHRAYRSPFQTAFVTEGWALYWEILLWDRGFPRTPEEKVGMLFWRMHRCARIIFSLGFHLGTMTPKECIDFLVDRVGHERDNATGEVRRSFAGGYGPLYQAAYLLGGMQFRALRRELVESGRMTDRAFHDAILRENRIPVEMIRAKLGGQELKEDFAPSWKFQGDVPAAKPEPGRQEKAEETR